jgi:hypothetical protein
MGLLSSSMKAELSLPNPNVFILVEVDFPDATKRYSKVGANSSTNGPYDSRVVSFGQLTSKISPLQNNLSPIMAQITIADTDFQFANRLGKGQRILNSAARIYLASPDVDQSSWFQLFGGILVGWSNTKPLEWTLELQTPDVRLETFFPRYELNSIDFAFLDKGANGTHRSNRRVLNSFTLAGYTPLIYGVHDDYGDKNAGAIPCPYVDTSTFGYLISIGYVTVRRVYSNGVLQATTAFTVSQQTINGRYYTLVNFTADQGTATISADVEGYDDIGDGTGDVLAAPTDVMQHLITNFVLNDYASGLWTTTDSTFIDTTSWDDVKYELFNRGAGASYACARYISNQLTGKQALEEFCQTFNLCPYWTSTGKLGLKIDSPNVATQTDTSSAAADSGAYFDSPFLRWEEMDRPKFRTDANSQANKVIATFETISNGGAGTNSSNTIPKEYYQIEVNDPLSTALKDDHFSLTWGPSTFP